jgi:hypothetical protein
MFLRNVGMRQQNYSVTNYKKTMLIKLFVDRNANTGGAAVARSI